MKDNYFHLAIILSLLLHAAFLVRIQMTRPPKEFLQEEIQATYKIERTSRPEREIVVEKPVPQTLLESALKSLPPPAAPADAFLKEISNIADNFKIAERQPERIKGLKVTKEVSIPMLKSEKINTPAYIGYYQIVRDRIRDRAYTNYTKLSVGEVYLTFIVRADGTLTELQVIEGKTTANEFLREIGIKSVREAAVFPPFPSDLNYPELTFNISISFQYHEE